MSQSVTYQQIHAYMLQKTREYYADPPEILVELTMAEAQKQGRSLSREQARSAVSPILIQRLIKEEMAQKWPEFMASIPSNPLSSPSEN